jgi:CheY-like chemotaxis protein
MIPRLLRYRKRDEKSLVDKLTETLEEQKRRENRPKRILFVEDDDNFREIFEHLTHPKFEVEIESAKTTGEAKRKIEAGQFDAALLDVRVTNGDGIWFYNFIVQRWPNIEVVFLTGYDSESLRRKIEKVGPARVFSKDRLLNAGFLSQLFSILGVSLKTQ